MLSPISCSMGLNVEVDMDTGLVKVDQSTRSGERVGPGPAFSAPKIKRTRLRTSCDACQNLKVKCSQDKPSCRRCSKNGLDCVYSPLRRMGRPKKPSAPQSAASSVASLSSPITTATLRSQSQSQSHERQRRRHDITTPSPASLMQSQPTGYALDGMENSSAAQVPSGLDNGDFGADGMYNGGMVLGAQDDTPREPYPATILEDRPDATSLASPGFFSLSTSQDGPSASTQQQPRLLTCPLTTLVSLDSQFGTNRGNFSSDGDQIRNKAGHCYLAILQRLTRLEATLDTNPQPPRLDVILSAERDTRQLKERIFACQGHGRREIDMVGSLTPKERSSQSCTNAYGSSLLVLSLLADRVTSLFEDLFRRAAVGSHSMDQATRVATAAWLYGSESDFASQARERQYERSVRSSFSRNIHCPVPEANCELIIGNYEVDYEVKSRVMKRILKKRFGALERMLGDVRDYLVDFVGQDDSPGREGNVHGTAEEQGSILIGNVKSRQGLSQAATAQMVKDLRRRVEMLRGRLELAGH